MDPKRLSIKTMKLVESVDARLGRIETALGLEPYDPAAAPAPHAPRPPAAAVPAPAPAAPPKGK